MQTDAQYIFAIAQLIGRIGSMKSPVESDFWAQPSVITYFHTAEMLSVASTSRWMNDFRGMKEIRVLGKDAFGTVTLVEDSSNGEQIALKSFNESGTTDRDASSTFFREIEALIRLAHRCIIPIVDYYLATSPSQIGMKFAVNGSLRDVPVEMAAGSRPRFMDETGIAVIICGVIVGMISSLGQVVIPALQRNINIFDWKS
jgi:hypothetical protein